MFRSPSVPTIAGCLLCLLAGCRPAGYQPTPLPQEPDPDALYEMPTPGSEEHLHASLFGSGTAPKTVLRPPSNAVTSASGLSSLVLRDGTGQRTPGAEDIVVVHFVGWEQSGEKFDSTLERGKPDRLPLQTLEAGWREGLQLMVVGEKRRLWIPERLAYGPVATPGRPAGDVVIDVELLEIVDPPRVPDAPADLTTPPADALLTATGLRTKVLKPGTGKVRPERTDRVLVHYTGWTADGEMFDSSIARGQPIAFGVTEVIPGWTEALMLMVEGEHRRLWIPGNLAYGDTPTRPGAPAGPLVFDVELIEIQR